MGMIWKTMPLLSTLAALVIIVHTAEEEAEYRSDLRPRILDTGTPAYEEPWRTLDLEPAMTQSEVDVWDNNSSGDYPRRRRPRKRRRRPQDDSVEDLQPQERNLYHEEIRPYHHENYNPHPEMPRRRRKKIDGIPSERAIRWNNDDIEPERPIRRRGQRRKRPPLEPIIEFDEYRGYHNNEESSPELTESTKDYTESIVESTERYEDSDIISNRKDISNEEIHIDDPRDQPNGHSQDYTNYYEKRENIEASPREDKSMSDFSSEVKYTINNQEDADSTIIAQDQYKDKVPANDAKKGNSHIEPMTLKAILKKSNGRSLSEILQQHNLSLTDLLHGKERALSVLTSSTSPLESKEVIYEEESKNSAVKNIPAHDKNTETANLTTIEPVLNLNIRESKNVLNNETTTQPLRTVNSASPSDFTNLQNNEGKETTQDQVLQVHSDTEETTTKITMRRRFPILGVRKKLRMRPLNTFKGQPNRDSAALTIRRYQNNRNITKSRDWKEMLPSMIRQRLNKTLITGEISKNQESDNHNYLSTVSAIETTTIPLQEYTSSSITVKSGMEMESSNSTEIPTHLESTDNKQTTTVDPPTTTVISNITEKPKIMTTTTKYVANASDLRRQAFNNRLKKKRLKQNKDASTDTPQDQSMRDIFGMANLVSASEFIAKVQPRTTNTQEEFEFTTLEDFMTTEASPKLHNASRPQKPKKTKSTTPRSTLQMSTEQTVKIEIEIRNDTFKNLQNGPRSQKPKKAKATTPRTVIQISTEESAKIEIEEILNDTQTSEKLSKILQERNMTLNELVEHRERGSSHVHLADIFHNTSREPNPTEPFLTKSSIEPISKEIYPLRVLLEANLHDPTLKTTTVEPNTMPTNYLNIPVVMDFGNNVNENGENMGIISLFNNLTNNVEQHSVLKQDSEGTPYHVSIEPVNNTITNETTRESRTLDVEREMISWNDIFSLMQKSQQSNSQENAEDLIQPETPNKVQSDKDIDGDGLIVLEDIQHLKNYERNIAPANGKDLHLELHEQTEPPLIPKASKAESNIKSVTVATASIIGLATVLFLSTYVIIKWKQNRSMNNKQIVDEKQIPSPVFEKRTGKINSSTRSRSPMLSTSNIYTIDTIDTHAGSESPEYMWDSLRKPFQ